MIQEEHTAEDIEYFKLMDQRHQDELNKLIKVFGDVKLGDGIGYFEACAIDYWETPDSEKYQAAKARDEREDWQKVYKILSEYKYDEYNYCAHCFMDVQGVLFFLPVMVLTGEDYTILQAIEILKDVLTTEQKLALIDIFETHIKNEYQDDYEFYLEYKGRFCKSCNTIHKPESYTHFEAEIKAQERVDGTEYPKMITILKEHSQINKIKKL
jgi:hypothetical protein